MLFMTQCISYYQLTIQPKYDVCLERQFEEKNRNWISSADMAWLLAWYVTVLILA